MDQPTIQAFAHRNYAAVKPALDALHAVHNSPELDVLHAALQATLNDAVQNLGVTLENVAARDGHKPGPEEP